VNTIYSFALVF